MGQRQYLGRLAAGVPAAAKSRSSLPELPRPTPFPTGHGPIHRLLRSQPARRLNQNQLFSSLSYCLLSPAAIVESVFFGHLLLDLFSFWRWASQGLPGQPQSQYCYPSTLSGPFHWSQPWFFIRFLPDVASQLSTPSPSLCAELYRPARGTREGPAQRPPPSR